METVTTNRWHPHPGACGLQTLAPPHRPVTLRGQSLQRGSPHSLERSPWNNIPTLDAFRRALESHLSAKDCGP
ncbi:hypothetical protein CesoFtcFv8_011995 [Champsocephalus esox]|uniref:Uncharacterized protein n=1 Tax=Champsocephalus esox TaxID=159716 RepID=A0AAN8GXU9_9TELE|nr:hypothetical protein CesoFtcFv8_011995 [Champsocephalus esox]